MDAFDWVSDSTKMVGVIFYFLIAVLALLDCLMASKKFMEGKQDRKALIAMVRQHCYMHSFYR